MSPSVCLLPRQQQGNVSAQKHASDNALRRSPETRCLTLKGLCRCINVNTGVLHWMVEVLVVEVLALVAISWIERVPRGSDVYVVLKWLNNFLTYWCWLNGGVTAVT